MGSISGRAGCGGAPLRPGLGLDRGLLLSRAAAGSGEVVSLAWILRERSALPDPRRFARRGRSVPGDGADDDRSAACRCASWSGAAWPAGCPRRRPRGGDVDRHSLRVADRRGRRRFRRDRDQRATCSNVGSTRRASTAIRRRRASATKSSSCATRATSRVSRRPPCSSSALPAPPTSQARFKPGAQRDCRRCSDLETDRRERQHASQGVVVTVDVQDGAAWGWCEHAAIRRSGIGTRCWASVSSSARREPGRAAGRERALLTIGDLRAAGDAAPPAALLKYLLLLS